MRFPKIQNWPPQATRKRNFILAVVALILFGGTGKAQEAVPPVAGAQLASVVVSSQVVGRTPKIIGYNMGENFPGSNVSSWLRYSEMNGARFWWSQNLWPEAQMRPNGGNSFATFEARRAQLRANPNAGIDWKAYEAKIALAYKGVPPGTIGSCFPLSELRKMDVNILIMMSHSGQKHPFDTQSGAPDWFGRWIFWRGVYANAFYLARTYDIERFQIFNEPDHRAHLGLQQSDYLRRLQLGSDAVQAAINDVNRIDGKSLRAQVSAPVTAGMMVFGPRKGRPDTRDVQNGWGELTMRTRQADFPGRSTQNQDLFQVYAFQNYGRTPERIATDLPRLHQLITAANGGAPLPMIVSEMNVSTAADFAKKTETLDSPGYYDAFGAIAAAYTNAGIDEVYVFRLTQADNFGNGQVKKNGTHIIDNADPLKNITSSTKGAEAVRLFMRGFKGARSRMAQPEVTGKNLYTVAARDETDGTCTLMISNLGEARTVALDLSAWQLPAGVLTTVEEVSAAHHGDVKAKFALPHGGKMTLPIAANSIVLVTVRPTLSGAAHAILPVTIEENQLRAQKPTATNGRVFLALQAAAQAPMRVRVYGGEGKLAQADLLGQAVVEAKSASFVFDVTRYVNAAKGKTLKFQIVPDEAHLDSKAFRLDAAQLQIFEAPTVKNEAKTARL